MHVLPLVNSEFNHCQLLHSRGACALDGLPGYRSATIPGHVVPLPLSQPAAHLHLCHGRMHRPHCAQQTRLAEELPLIVTARQTRPDTVVEVALTDGLVEAGPQVGEEHHATASPFDRTNVVQPCAMNVDTSLRGSPRLALQTRAHRCAASMPPPL